MQENTAMIIAIVEPPEGYRQIEEKFALYVYDDSYYMQIKLANADLIIQVPEGCKKFVTDVRYARRYTSQWRINWYADATHGELCNASKHCEHNLKWKVEDIIYDEFTLQREDADGTQFIHAMRDQSPLITTKVHTREGHQTLGLELGQNNLIMYTPDIQILPLTLSVPENTCKKKRK